MHTTDSDLELGALARRRAAAKWNRPRPPESDARELHDLSARAKKIENGSPSLFKTVGVGEPFAIHNRGIQNTEWFGANRYAGLRYPHIDGAQNGQPYRYACTVPTILTDAVDDDCAGKDTYYRLPFPDGDATLATKATTATSHTTAGRTSLWT